MGVVCAYSRKRCQDGHAFKRFGSSQYLTVTSTSFWIHVSTRSPDDSCPFESDIVVESRGIDVAITVGMYMSESQWKARKRDVELRCEVGCYLCYSFFLDVSRQEHFSRRRWSCKHQAPAHARNQTLETSVAGSKPPGVKIGCQTTSDTSLLVSVQEMAFRRC